MCFLVCLFFEMYFKKKISIYIYYIYIYLKCIECFFGDLVVVVTFLDLIQVSEIQRELQGVSSRPIQKN